MGTLHREECVAGIILQDGPPAFAELKARGVSPAVFQSPLGLAVWNTAAELQGQFPDTWAPPELLDKLPSHLLDDLGRIQVAGGLYQSSIPRYAEEVIAASQRRQAVQRLGELKERMERGEDVGALLDEIRHTYEGGGTATAPFTALRLGEFLAKPYPSAEPVVDRLFNLREFTLLSADAKLGKTWLALQMALSVSSGLRFLGFSTSPPGPVLYLNMEIGGSAMQDRARKLAERLAVSDADLFFVNALDEPQRPTPSTLSAKIGATLKRYGIEGRCRLLVVDPFYALALGVKENDSSEVAPVLYVLKSIGETYGPSVFLLHHTGKGESVSKSVRNRARGSSSFMDVPDNYLTLVRTSEEHRAQLDGFWRNLPGLPPQDLAFDKDTCLWSSLGDSKEPVGPRKMGRAPVYTVDDLVRLLKDSPDGYLSRDQFIEAGIGKSAWPKLRDQAVDEGKIVKTHSRNKDFYRLPEDGEAEGG